jgi:hypothetical protein
MMDDKEGMVAILGVGCSSAVCIGFGCGSSAGGSEPQVYLCGAGFFIYPELTHSLHPSCCALGFLKYLVSLFGGT